MDLELAGKTAWVIGATGAIGRRICDHLAAEGARIAVTSRRPEAVGEVAAGLRDAGAEVLEAPADAADPGATREAAGRIAEAWGALDILVSTVAVPAFGPFLEIDADTFREAIEAKFIGSVNAMQAAIPLMRKAGGGSIICITGGSGKRPIGIHLPGGSVNAGLNLVVRGLANEFGPEGIRVNVVSPGRVRSPRQDAMLAAAGANDPTAAIPLRRFAETEEVADAVLFLASPRASYITGHVLTVDGGAVLTL